MDMEGNIAIENVLLRAELKTLQETLDQLKRANPDFVIEENDANDHYQPEPSTTQHSHFDDSIKAYFNRSEQKYYGDEDAEDVASTAMVTVPKKELTELKYNILYENLYRLAGITIFPLNKQLLGNEDYLGLRFDLFSSLTRKFKTPHYVILRKAIPNEAKLAGQLGGDGDTLRWTVHRHTLPVFIPIDEYSKQLLVGVDEKDPMHVVAQFATTIRAQLLRLNYNHDKFDMLRLIKFTDFGIDREEPLISALDKDLQCRHVRITLSTYFKGQLVLEFMCNPQTIETATLITAASSSFDPTNKVVCECMLRNSSLVDLRKSFRKVCEFLLRKQLAQ